MKYASGNTYEGEWKEDKKCGKGVMIWKTVGETYVGSWENDMPHGFGEHIWGVKEQDKAEAAPTNQKSGKQQLTCNMYRGEWKEGIRYGLGSFFYSNGSQYSGHWENNQKHGRGVLIYQDGRIVATSFKRDRLRVYNGPAAAQAGKGGAPPKVGEDATPQYRLNVVDMLKCLPRVPLYPPLSDEKDVYACEVKDLERVLLLHNTTLRSLYFRYSFISNAQRTAWDALPKNPTLPSSSKNSLILSTRTADWTVGEKAMYKARSFNNRLYCMTLAQFKQFARDIGLLGPYLSSFDIGMIFKRMKLQHRLIYIR